jgi:type I restriction enzyme S subunit
MSFARYPAYNDSGVEWLGEVPAHWTVRRLKRACDVFPSNVDKKMHEGETPVLLCNYTDVYYNESIVEGMDLMSATASEDQIAKFTLRAGDTIITKDSETADDIAIAAHVPADLPGVVCGYHLSMVRPRSEARGAFVKRLFDSAYAKACFAVRANGLTRVGLGQYELDNVELPFPPVAEQAAIAVFLDRETAKIDALVAEQQRLIDLLKEKRQAVISHAVTKGLNPDAPMKPTGVEWLGDVPSHWKVAPVKHFFATTSGGTPDTEQQAVYYTDADGGGIPWVRTTDLKNERLVEVEIHITERALADTACSILPVGAVLVAMYGGEGSVGKNGLLGIRAAINQAVCALLPSNSVLPDFAFRYVQNYRPYWMIGAESARKAPNISQDLVRNSPFLCPPLAEQRVIVAQISKLVDDFESLTAEAQRAIDLLLERRTALISAAVTGQIDVRTLVKEATP